MAGNLKSRPRFSPALLIGGAGVFLLSTSVVILATDVLPVTTIPAAPTTPTTLAATTQSTSQPGAQNAGKKEEDIARVMDFFKTTQPDVYEQALALKASDPLKFAKLIHGASSMVNKLEDMRKHNPKLFELKIRDLQLAYQSVRVAKELKRTDLLPAERDRLTKELNDIVSQHFDVCQKYREQEIDDLKLKVSDLDAQLQARSKDKDELIQKRVDDLVENSPHLDW